MLSNSFNPEESDRSNRALTLATSARLYDLSCLFCGTNGGWIDISTTWGGNARAGEEFLGKTRFLLSLHSLGPVEDEGNSRTTETAQQNQLAN